MTIDTTGTNDTPQPDALTAAHNLLEQSRFILERFLVGYMCDNGVRLKLIEQKMQDTSYMMYPTYEAMLKTALRNINGESFDAYVGGPTFSLENVIAGAASLDLLARWAREFANDRILPHSVIPNDTIVDAALKLYHAGKNERVTHRSGPTVD